MRIGIGYIGLADYRAEFVSVVDSIHPQTYSKTEPNCKKILII